MLSPRLRNRHPIPQVRGDLRARRASGPALGPPSSREVSSPSSTPSPRHFPQQRRFLFRVAVVGSGPAGFYATEEILAAKGLEARVDLFDQFPTPTGLVRYGVAPDHPEVKIIDKKFDEILADERVRFVGGVPIGQAVQVSDLRANYDAVVLAYGADTDKTLGIPGEATLKGVYGARAFVGWYNGHPENTCDVYDLSGESAAIFGNGNVALDVARILVSPLDELKTTDITDHAVQQLAKSKIREVHIIGRRGPVQAAFTTKELRELTKLTGVQTLLYNDTLPVTSVDEEELKDRPKKRQFEVLAKLKGERPDLSKKKVYLHFLEQPKEFVESPTRPGHLGAVRCEKTRLEGSTPGNQSAQGTGEIYQLNCDIAFRSIGYKSIALPGIPFDVKRGVVPSVEGAVVNSAADASREAWKDLYVVGWLKRGPSGIIGTNKWDAIETVQRLVQDVSSGKLKGKENLSEANLPALLSAKKVNLSHTVDYKDWKALDSFEVTQGSPLGKPREKVPVQAQMMAVILQNRPKAK